MVNIVSAATLGELADRCAEILRTTPSDPFQNDWIATPTAGVRDWLQRRLAEDLGATSPGARDGICANVDFARADGMRRALLTSLADRPGAPIGVDAESWSIEAMTWALMAIGSERDDERGHPAPAGNRLPIATQARIDAARFARYHVYRPDIITDWADPTVPDAPADASDPAGRDGQATRHRRLVELLGPDPVTRLRSIVDDPDGPVARDSELPPRLLLFGFVLPPDGEWFDDLTGLLGNGGREIHAFFLDHGGPDVESGEGHATSLGRVWGRTATRSRLVRGESDHLSRDDTGRTDLLGRLQTSITDERVAALPVDPLDRSIVFHDGQGLERQVEVLRDEILHRLAADPTLTEEDVVVLCRDVDAVAPTITSVLGRSLRSGDTGDDGDVPRLRYHVDGASRLGVNPVAEGFVGLLHLLGDRITSADLLRFLHLEAVRTRWDLTPDDLVTIRRWIDQLNIRWGLDPTHRRRFGVSDAVTFGTWRRAITRLAAGIALADDDLVLDMPGDDAGPSGRFAPVGTEGGGISLVGRLHDLLGRLEHLVTVTELEQPVTDLLDALGEAIDAFLGAPADRPEQLDQIRAICRLPEAIESRPEIVDLLRVRLTDIRPQLVRLAEGGRGSSGLFRPGVTFTTPDAVRGIPYRVVAFLGLDDTWIPTGIVDSGDLMIDDAQPGDPAPRDDARFSLLTAVLAARDAIVVTRNSRSITTNEPLPEGIIVSQLLDAVDRLVETDRETDERPSRRITRVHRRHGTHADYFRIDSELAMSDATGRRPWSFDARSLDARLAVDRHPGWRRPELAETSTRPLTPDRRDAVVALDDLVAFFHKPDRYVSRNTFGLHLPRDEDDPTIDLPTEIDSLERFNLTAAVLTAIEGDEDLAELRDRLHVTDRLPIGASGDAAFETVRENAQNLHDAAERLRSGRRPDEVTIDVSLSDQRRLLGDVTVYLGSGDEQDGPGVEEGLVVDVRPSGAPKGDDRLAATARLLALGVTDPRRRWTSVLLRRGGSKDPLSVTVQSIGPTNDQTESDHRHDALGNLVRVFDVAKLGPVPLFPNFLGKRGAWLSDNSVEGKWTSEHVAQVERRVLYGYRSFEEVSDPIRYGVHPDDPGAGDVVDEGAEAEAPTRRVGHLHQTVLEGEPLDWFLDDASVADRIADEVRR